MRLWENVSEMSAKDLLSVTCLSIMLMEFFLSAK
jgi:hypothetical protein